MKHIRNFSIVAHIDHGKSTLADRLIQFSGIIDNRNFKNQILDNMEIERERGITIKSQAITLPYKAKNGIQYILNMIDTPGHVDFSYEVSRSIASCEGVLLLIDAIQGVQAQTVANLFIAMENNVEIIPIINKIDLPAVNIDFLLNQISSELGLDPLKAIQCSAKQGIGIENILESIVNIIPCPKGNPENQLTALIFDAQYDQYLGVIIHCRLFNGTLKPGNIIRFIHNNATYKVEEVGIFLLKRQQRQQISCGEVGYIIAGIKKISDVKIGDTITNDSNPCIKNLSGFKNIKPVVYCSIYPISTNDYIELETVLEKYRLNDSSFVYQKDSSIALGQGFRCGFLGLLHLDIVQERLEREYNLSIILSVPSVKYKFTLPMDNILYIENPMFYPNKIKILKTEEPYARIKILSPDKYLGKIMKLCLEKRGINSHFTYINEKRIKLYFNIPLSEVIYDFYDQFKSLTQGYGSCDYELIGYYPSELILLDILVNGKKVDALSQITHRKCARIRGINICEKLKEHIPRHQFKISIQAAIGNEIIARTTISALRKDVTAKCYGGDITRKRKLLDKQRKGKKRMKIIGSVCIPQDAFLSVLKNKTFF